MLNIVARKVVKTITSGDGPNGVSYSALKPAPASSREIAIPMPAHDDDDMSGMEH